MLFAFGCCHPRWISKALQLSLLLIPGYVPAAQHCQRHRSCNIAFCICLSLHVWSSHIDRRIISFKLQDSFQSLWVFPVQTFCSRTGCCLHSCAVLRGHRNSEKNRPVGFRSTTSEADVCLALVKGWIHGFLFVVNIIYLCEKCTFPTRSLFCITACRQLHLWDVARDVLKHE